MIDKKKLNDAMKGKKTPTQPTDPNMTLEVQNPEVEELMKNYAQEKTPEHLNQLIEKLRLSRMLVPANLNDKKQPVPCLIKSPTGELFLPIYTSKQQIPKEPKIQKLSISDSFSITSMGNRYLRLMGPVVKEG